MERTAVESVPRDPGLQALLGDQGKRLAERVIHADRRRVVIEAVATPVALDHRQVEVPALNLRLPLIQYLDGPRSE